MRRLHRRILPAQPAGVQGLEVTLPDEIIEGYFDG
jgi:hypothetical protein